MHLQNKSVEVRVIKVFYWQYEQLDMLGGVPVNHYHSGFIKALSELDVPDGADIQEGVFLTLSELEQREREAFEAAMKAADDWHCKIDVWASRENPLHTMPIKLTYNDYKKSRGSRE